MIYAGADLFLMPSISEPCGLSQMIAMRFGTIPIVRETGGLKDTVVPYGVPNDNGFSFANVNPHDMVWVLGQAVDLYYNDKERWQVLQRNGMTRDFSWSQSALDYVQIYKWATGADTASDQEETPEEAAPVPPQEEAAGAGDAALLTDMYCVSNMKQEGEHFTLRIVEDGCPINNAQPVQPNLEDVFLYYCRGERHDTSDTV